MRISAVVNTCCLGERASLGLGSSGRRHGDRVEFMRRTILPRLTAEFDEVIVVGEFEPGTGYQYVQSPSRYFNCRDVLAQREAGFRLAQYDVILFQMDDHVTSEGLAEAIRKSPQEWDVLSPGRYSLRTRTLLNSGWNDQRPMYQDNPYLHTHAIAMRRSAVVQCPWIGLPPIHHFDVVHSMWFRDAGLRVAIRSDLHVYDLEE